MADQLPLADDLPHDYCARPRTRYVALSNAMLASKAFYAAMAPTLYSDVVLIGSRIIHQFQVSVLERRPDLIKLVRTLTVRLNIEDFGLHHLSEFLLDSRWSNLQHICLIVTSQEQHKLDSEVSLDSWFYRHFSVLSQAFEAKGLPFQFINPSHYERENPSGHLFDSNCVAPHPQNSITIHDNSVLTVIEVPFRQQHALIWLLDDILDDKHVSRLGFPISRNILKRARHLKVVRQYQGEDSWSAQHDLGTTNDQLLSLEFIAAGKDPLDMETLCETAAGNINLRSLKLVGNLKMCPDDPQNFWFYLPKSIESLEMTINQIHFIEPLYEDLRRPPRSRLYAPKLKHFICHLDLDIERFDWLDQRDNNLLEKWNVYLEEPESDDDWNEEWQQYYRDYDNAEMQFMHCFLGSVWLFVMNLG